MRIGTSSTLRSSNYLHILNSSSLALQSSLQFGTGNEIYRITFADAVAYVSTVSYFDRLFVIDIYPSAAPKLRGIADLSLYSKFLLVY